MVFKKGQKSLKGMLGKHHSEETKEKIRLKNLGKKCSPQTICKMKETMKRRIESGKFKSFWDNPDFRKKYPVWNKGYKQPIEQRKKRKLSINKFWKEHPEERIRLSRMRKGDKKYGRTGSQNKHTGTKHKQETIEKMKQKRALQIVPIKDTKIEVKIQNLLKELNIKFFTHQYIKEIEHGYQCDIFIPSLNLVIECDGDYWHNYPTGTEIDNIRTKELLEKGFKVLRLWEHEINSLSIEQFKNKLEDKNAKN